MSPYNISMATLHLFGEFGVKSKSELVQRAREMGLV